MQRLWQAFIVVLIVGSLVFTALTFAAIAGHRDDPSFGFRTAAVAGNVSRVVSVTPGSPAARAGLKPGDRVALSDPFADRLQLIEPVVGDVLTLELTGAGGRRVQMVAQEGARPPLGLSLAFMLLRFAFLAMAALLALRVSAQAAGRNLALFLACFGAALSIDFSLASPLWLRFACFFAAESLYLIGVCAALGFAMQFPRTTAAWQRAILRALPAIFVLGMMLLAAQLTTETLYGGDLPARIFSFVYASLFIALIALTCAGFFFNYRACTGTERVRMRWVLMTFAFGFGGIAVSLAVVVFSGTLGSWAQYLSLTIVAMPFGLAYVILRHRMLDIGFVVNRALVYTGVSVVVVGTFIVFEWLLGHVIDEHSRASTVLQLGGALVLGLSVRYIHNSVDRYVDDLFFRDRHEAERAVRRFAHEALLITDATELVDKTVDVAQRKMRLAACAFYARYDGAYSPVASTFDGAPAVSENDYAVLHMRTWHSAADLHESDTNLPGELTLPMVVRGELAGFLLCGEKASHEAFAPDEREALELLARDAGIALDSLRTRAIEHEIGVLAADGALPPSVRVRLEELAGRAQPAGSGARSSQGIPPQGATRQVS